MHPSNHNGASQTALLILIALLALAAGFGLSHYLGGESEQDRLAAPLKSITRLNPPKPLQDNFRLADHDGKPFDLNGLKGHWSFVFFGYTHCPDVCPITLKVMQSVWEKLPQTPTPVKLYFVSVDPDRDDPDTLKKYAQYFNPDFIGVTGKADDIDRFTEQLGILYGFEDKNEKTGDYLVNHSAQVLVIDPQGRWYGVLSPPFEPVSIAADFQQLQKHSGD